MKKDDGPQARVVGRAERNRRPEKPPKKERDRSWYFWQTAVALLAALLLLSWGWFAGRPQEVAGSPGVAVQAAEGDPSAQYKDESAKAEVLLLKEALEAAKEVNAHHRHHSVTMWELLKGKITVQEAWWQGGDSTCAGWLSANKFEETLGRLKGQAVQGEPMPKEALEFCKQARERR